MVPSEDSSVQIDRDVGRTFPLNSFFRSGNKGYKKLRKVLRAFSCQNQEVDYVQGMNFIVGQLLVHCDHVVAFNLFVDLVEEYGLKDIF